MLTKAQEYFYTLLLNRELIQEGISDVFEATVYRHDDIDISDVPTQNGRALNILKSAFSNENTLILKWNIAPEDSLSIQRVVFGFNVNSRSELLNTLKSSSGEEKGMIFELLRKFLTRNITIPDELFTQFRSSNSKEFIEPLASESFLQLLHILENQIRTKLQGYESITEKLLQSKDFLDDAELVELSNHLTKCIIEMIQSLETHPEISKINEKFKVFWEGLVL